MISLLTKVQIIDNSGGLIGRCIKILKPLRKHARVGDLILISVIKTAGSKEFNKVQKGDVVKALVVRSTFEHQNLKWDENAVVLVKTAPKSNDYTPIGTRFKGPISSTLRFKKGCQKVISLAKLLI